MEIGTERGGGREEGQSGIKRGGKGVVRLKSGGGSGPAGLEKDWGSDEVESEANGGGSGLVGSG